jgi:tRNA(Ile)-lysidine synthase TilS/MesJ
LGVSITEKIEEQGYTISNMVERWIMDASNEVDVFSRGSIQMTFELLRKSNPRLALAVRNIAGGEPLSKNFDDLLDDKNSDHFRVEMDSKEVREVVEELMFFTHPDAVDINNPSVNILARTLMQDWLLLAHQMVVKLTDESPAISAMSPSHPTAE